MGTIEDFHLKVRGAIEYPRMTRRLLRQVGACLHIAHRIYPGGAEAIGVETRVIFSSRRYRVIVLPLGGSYWCVAGVAWRGEKRWSVDVNHRHGILESNTMLNFAGGCWFIRDASDCFLCRSDHDDP